MDFRIVKKGYDTKETKDYILKITKEREEEISKKNAIILNLKDRLSTLSDRVKEMESQKRLISLSLLKAVEKAEEIDAISQQKYSEELASLKSFHLRWTALYNRLIEKYPLDEELKNAKEFTKKINEIFILPNRLDKDAIEQFNRETKRQNEEKKLKEKPEIADNSYDIGDEEIAKLLSQIETDL